MIVCNDRDRLLKLIVDRDHFFCDLLIVDRNF